MPIITVWGIGSFDQLKLEYLRQDIVAGTLGIVELGLSDENEVTVQFLDDMLRKGLGEEIILRVHGLFDRPERTDKVRQLLSENLTRVVRAHHPGVKIETLIHEFNPKRGYCRYDPEAGYSQPSMPTVAIGDKGIAATTGDTETEDGGILRI